MNQSKQKKAMIYIGGLATVISVLRVIHLSNCIGDLGVGYYSLAYEIYSVFFIISSFAITNCVSKMVATRVSRGQTRNAHKVFWASIHSSLLISIIFCALLELFATPLAELVFSQQKSVFAIRFIAPALIFVSVASCIRGYLKGLGFLAPVSLSELAEQVLIWIFSIVFANQMFAYGTKVSNLLLEPAYSSVYGAAGAMIGITFGSAILFVILLVIYRGHKGVIQKGIAKDATMKDESYKQISHNLFVSTVPRVITYLLLTGPVILGQLFWNKSTGSSVLPVTMTEDFGVFYGKYRSLVLIPVIFIVFYSRTVTGTIRKMISEQAFKMVREYIRIKTKQVVMITIPLSISLAMLARPICSVLFSGNIDLAVVMVQIGSLAVFFYGLLAITNQILAGTMRSQATLFHLFVAFVIYCVVIFVLFNETKIGMNGIVVSNLIFVIVCVVLDFMTIGKLFKFRHDWKDTFLLPLGAGAVMLFIQWILVSLLQKSAGNIICIIVAGIFGPVIYWLTILILHGITEKELSGIPGNKWITSLAHVVHAGNK